MDFLFKAAGIIGFLILIFFPGGWITFGLPLSSWSFWNRLSLGAILAPLVVLLQFYAVRLLGVSFEHTPLLLTILNLPAVILIWRKKGDIPLPTYRTMVYWTPAILIPLACVVGLLLVWPHWRLVHGHPWMYSDAVYMIANGELIPEDTILAGVTLSYPWAAHIYQAVLTYLIDQPPFIGSLWMNLFGVVFVAQLTAGLVTRLGGNRFAAISSVIGLFFGVNFLGYFLAQALPEGIVKISHVWGDYRYTPWFLKFCSFNQDPLALGFFSGITFLMADQWSEEHEWGRPGLVFMLLVGLGLFYPQLIPIGYAVTFGGLVGMFMKNFKGSRPLTYHRLIVVGLAIFLATVISFAYLGLVTHDSIKATMLGISGFHPILRKSLVTFIVTFPLLCGLCLVLPRLWISRRSIVLPLLMGIFASCVLHVFLSIPYFDNEYKFIFTAAICFAPFFGIALEPFLSRLRHWALPFTLILALILAGPFFHKLYAGKLRLKQSLQGIPLVDTRHFDLRLDQRERFARLTNIIREKTPKETLLVADQLDFNLPTVTRRKLFAPPELNYMALGVNLTYGTILHNVRGYNKDLIEERVLLLRKLFNGGDTELSAESLQWILRSGRPIGIILDESRNRNLLNWLVERNIGVRLYTGEGLVLWLVMPSMARGHNTV